MKQSTVRKAVGASAAMTLAVSLVLVAGGVPARADLSPAAAGASRAQADYALDTFGDPWDFSNAEDFEVTPGVQSEGVHNLSMAGGVLHGDVDGFGKFMFIRSWSGLSRTCAASSVRWAGLSITLAALCSFEGRRLPRINAPKRAVSKVIPGRLHCAGGMMPRLGCLSDSLIDDAPLSERCPV